MNRILAALLISISTTLCSGQTIHEDLELGIRLKIPVELEKNWEITHTPTCAHLDIFLSETDEDPFFVLLLGKWSVDCVDADLLRKFCTDQIEAALGEENLFEGDDFSLEFETVQEGEIGGWTTITYRLYLGEGGLILPIDIHVFEKNRQVFALATATYPCDDASKLDAFSETILSQLEILR